MNNKNWKEVIEKNYSDIMEKIREAKKAMYGTDQSLHVDVEISQDGEVYTTGLLTGSTFTKASFEGESFTITSIEGWESDVNISDYMQDFEPEKLKEYEKEYDDYSGLWEFLEEKYPEVIEEAEQDYFECYMDEYYPDYIIEEKLGFLDDFMSY